VVRVARLRPREITWASSSRYAQDVSQPMRLGAGVIVVATLLGVTVRSAVAAPPSLYVRADGNDASRCSRSVPCASFRRAYSLARAGATVFVAAGIYPTQTLFANNARLTASSRVVFRPLSGKVIVARADLEGSSHI